MRTLRLDELTARRERQRLLAALDAVVIGSPRRRVVWRPAAVAALLLIGIAFGVLLGLRSPIAEPPISSRFVVELESKGARWSRHYDGHLHVVVLEDGLLSVRSSAKGPDDRLLVRVPDGEIEDVGTQFTVLVQAERTRRIEVSEGQVVFRAKDGSEREIEAGRRWELEDSTETMKATEGPKTALGETAVPPRADAAPTAVESIPAAPGAGRGPVVPGPRRKLAAAGDSSVGGVPAVEAARSEPARAAGRAFADALGALRAGHALAAASAFESFIESFPSDPRAEDASFLCAVAHARAGDAEGAAELASRYLARYPKGLRRVEAERMANTRRP
jgi:TolA-binding protein